MIHCISSAKTTVERFKQRLITNNLTGNIRMQNILHKLQKQENNTNSDNIHSCIISIKNL